MRNGHIVRTAPASDRDRGDALSPACSARRAEAEKFEKPPASTAPVMLEVARTAPRGCAQRHLPDRAGGRDRRPRRPRRERAQRACSRDRRRRSDRCGDDHRRWQAAPNPLASRRDRGGHRVPHRGAQEGRPVHGADRSRRTPRLPTSPRCRRAACCGGASSGRRRARCSTAVGRSAGAECSREEPFGRQPAEGALRPLAVLRPTRADSRRADARRRRRALARRFISSSSACRPRGRRSS